MTERINGQLDRLPPRVLQIFGLCWLAGFAVFWMLTGRVEPTFLAVGGGLVGLGQYQGAVRGLRNGATPAPAGEAK